MDIQISDILLLLLGVAVAAFFDLIAGSRMRTSLRILIFTIVTLLVLLLFHSIYTKSMIEYCESSEQPITDSCRARDQSGFHGEPYGQCTVTIEAPTGFEFLSESYNVVEFHARREALGPNNIRPINNGNQRISGYSGTVACTNETGTGRTCEVRVTISASAYPTFAKFFGKLQKKNCVDLIRNKENVNHP